MNDAAGLKRLLALGTRKVPLVAQGTRYVFAENVDRLAEFIGLGGSGHTPLSPEQLFHKWMLVWNAALRYIRQLPNAQLKERIIPNRDRAIRLTCHHIFFIGDAFLETMQGTVYSEWHAQREPEPGTLQTTEEIAQYGEGVMRRVQAWWQTLEDRSGRRPVNTYMGPQPMHFLFERSVWHSAQHVRQIMAVLERNGIVPERPLTKEDLAGLPLPERLWE